MSSGTGRDDPDNPKLAVADFRFRGRVEPPVTLREIRNPVCLTIGHWCAKAVFRQ